MSLPLAAACEDMCVALPSLQGSGQPGTAKSEPYKGSLLLHLWRSELAKVNVNSSAL